ncbi:hypothetical protein ACFWP0_19890 [Achromobacter sp. NPDC058515]
MDTQGLIETPEKLRKGMAPKVEAWEAGWMAETKSWKLPSSVRLRHAH